MKEVNLIKQYARKCRKDVIFINPIFPSDHLRLSYLVGLIASDGNIVEERESVRFEISPKDREMLEFIASELADPPVPIYEVNRKNRNSTIRIQFKHSEMVDFCYMLGFGGNKSKTLSIDWSKVDSLYFLRGVIDGDGCVQVGKLPSQSSVRITSGSHVFIESIVNIFGGTVVQCDGCQNVQFKGSFAIDICKKLPKEKWMLQRKTERIEQISKQKILKIRKNGCPIR